MINRFELIKSEHLTLGNYPGKIETMDIKIIKDRQTGVMYVCTDGGITPMLDNEGRLILDK